MIISICLVHALKQEREREREGERERERERGIITILAILGCQFC